MAKQTTNFGFVKPDTNDFYDVSVQNANWDKLDEELKPENWTFTLEDGSTVTKLVYVG